MPRKDKERLNIKLSFREKASITVDDAIWRRMFEILGVFENHTEGKSLTVEPIIT